MKKIIIFAVLIIVIGAVLVLLRGDEDNWICQDSQWVKHGNPSKPMPTTLCEGQKEVREIELYLPAAGDKTIGTKFVIYGKGRAFESQINYQIVDAQDGRELLFGNLMINAEMGQFGYFYKEIDLSKELKSLPTDIALAVFDMSPKDGTVINKTDTIELAVSQNYTPVFAYFSNDNLDPEISCNKTFAIARLVPKTQSVLKAAIEELLKGPTSAEAKLGFGTLINSGVTINSVNISGNTATIDLSPKLDENMGGSCRVAAIRSQIINTAKQFTNIKNVIISINGESELILQP